MRVLEENETQRGFSETIFNLICVCYFEGFCKLKKGLRGWKWAREAHWENKRKIQKETTFCQNQQEGNPTTKELTWFSPRRMNWGQSWAMINHNPAKWKVKDHSRQAPNFLSQNSTVGIERMRKYWNLPRVQYRRNSETLGMNLEHVPYK